MLIDTRQALIKYCLRKLGEPVIEVNVSEEQMEDCVDDALQVYREFHSDATYRTYWELQLTQEDIDNGYVAVPSSIIYVTKVFPRGGAYGLVGAGGAMFPGQIGGVGNIAGAIQGGTGGLSYLYQMQSYAALIDMTIIGLPIVTFSRRQNRLYLWGDNAWAKKMPPGSWICCEVYNTFEDYQIWDDMFMKNFTTALIKQQWGQNMSKFDGMQLPGGVTINGKSMLEEATVEIRELRERMRLEQEVPPDFLVG